MLHLQKYAPQAAALPTTNGPWATGEGLALGAALGGALTQMGEVQVHPTGFVDPADPDAGTKVIFCGRVGGWVGVEVGASSEGGGVYGGGVMCKGLPICTYMASWFATLPTGPTVHASPHEHVSYPSDCRPHTHTLQWLAPEKLRGCGALLLSPSGHRFVDELTTRDKVAAAIQGLPGQRCWLVLGQEGAAEFGEGTLGFYASKKMVTKVRRTGAEVW